MSGKNVYPCFVPDFIIYLFVPDFKKETFHLPLPPHHHFVKSDIACGLFTRAFIMLKYDHYLAILWRVFFPE